MASTPEYPSSPSAAELGMETSSVGSHRSGPRDRPSLLRASSSHSQHNVERYLSSVPEAYSSNAFYASQSPLSRAREMAIFDGREDADQVLLCKYRNDLMPRHPFVIVPDHLPASTLKVHHPFVMLVIRVITSFDDLRTIHARMHRLTGLIADRMFRHAERSLDLLMGIVMLLGWHHYNCPKHSQLNNLLCLAESLVSDLGLNRRPLVREDGQEEGGTIQEKRLLLGVWYLRSSCVYNPKTYLVCSIADRCEQTGRPCTSSSLLQCLSRHTCGNALSRSKKKRNMSSTQFLYTLSKFSTWRNVLLCLKPPNKGIRPRLVAIEWLWIATSSIRRVKSEQRHWLDARFTWIDWQESSPMV